MDSNDDGPASSNDGRSTQVLAVEGFEGFDHKHGPLYGVNTSGLRWREMLRRYFGVVISDGEREAPSTDDGEQKALSTDDRQRKAPTADSKQDNSPMPGLAGTNNDCLSDCDDPDMPELGDSDDGNDVVDDEQTSPRTLTDVDELLGEALAGPEERSDVKDGATSSSSSTAPPTNTGRQVRIRLLAASTAIEHPVGVSNGRTKAPRSSPFHLGMEVDQIPLLADPEMRSVSCFFSIPRPPRDHRHKAGRHFCQACHPACKYNQCPGAKVSRSRAAKVMTPVHLIGDGDLRK
eukprot:g22048.t1